MDDREQSAQARGRRAEELFKAATRIGMDVGAILSGDSSATSRERLLQTIERDFLPRLREYGEELSREKRSSAATDSVRNLIGFSERLSDRVQRSALEWSDRPRFLDVWWPFQREAALWSDITLLRDRSTGKIKPELLTDEDRQADDFRAASMIFFENAGSNGGKGPTLRELHALLQANESTKHIAWQELDAAPHLGPLRRLTRKNHEQ